MANNYCQNNLHCIHISPTCSVDEVTETHGPNCCICRVRLHK